MQKIFLFIFLEYSICSISIKAQETSFIQTDVCIVGAGSSGIGAALAASRAGAEIVLIEKSEKVGGTGTLSYVNNWEPGPGCSYSKEIYNRLVRVPFAVTIGQLNHPYRADEPYGLNYTNPHLNYNYTLRRSDLSEEQFANVMYDVNAFDKTVRQMLHETGKCKLLLQTSFIRALAKDKTVQKIIAVSGSGQKYEITAKVFIDCTGDGYLCRDLGCETMTGEEPKSVFGEPTAPDDKTDFVNAISLCYRIKPGKDAKLAFHPEKFKDIVAFSTGPVGVDQIFTINPLGIIEGSLILKYGHDSIYKLGRELVDKHWATLQKYPHFRNFEFVDYAPKPGIRESYRIFTEYVLTQNDLLKGLKGQQNNSIITVADHLMDTHGRKSITDKYLKEAYGIPYACLIPRGWKNLLVAGRCAGFSHIAASSCRLQRTMMSTGHAAGFAAWLSIRENLPVNGIPVSRLQAEMNLTLREKEKYFDDPQPVFKIIGNTSHELLCSDNGTGMIYKINESGVITWSYPVSDCQDLKQLSNGNIIYTFYREENGIIRGGICEINPAKNEVFRYEIDGEVHSFQRLENGNTIITDNNNARLIEVNNRKEIVKSLKLNTSIKGHSAVRMVRVIGNGNYLVCQEEDGLVVEYRPDGEIASSIKSSGKCFEAIRLKNGHTLVSDGPACSITEFDKKGKEIWKISRADFPEIKMNWLTGIEELPNGNILVCNWLGHGRYGEGIPIFEVTKDKKIAWYFTDNVNTGSISNVFVIKQ